MQKCVVAVLVAGLSSLPFFSQADSSALLARLRITLVQKPVALKPTLVPGFLGVLYPGDTSAEVFVDEAGTIIGSNATGYAYLTGAKKGAKLDDQDAKALFYRMLKGIPKDKLITYRFGNGQRKVILITAYDCPACRKLEATIHENQTKLNATIYIVPTALAYGFDPQAPDKIQSLLCANDPAKAWFSVMQNGKLPLSRCNADPASYAFLYRIFPVKVPPSVPTAITDDGVVYAKVIASFSEVFQPGRQTTPPPRRSLIDAISG